MYSIQVAGVATAVTLGAIVYSQTNFFVPPPPYLNAITQQGVSVAKFDKIYEKLRDVSYGKGVNKEEVASILFREDDPLRSWQTRYYALKSAIEIHPSFFFAATYEKLLKNKNILIIKQGNTETRNLYDFSDAAAKSHNVFLHTFSEEKDKTICKVLKQYTSLTGQPLDAVTIKGHGNKFEIILGESAVLDRRSFASDSPLTDCFQKYLKNYAPIIFSSCSTGDRLQANETLPSLAEVAAANTDHPVYAATQALCDLECRYKIDPLPLAEIYFECAKNFLRKDDPPEMKLGPYIKRFEPGIEKNRKGG